MTLFVLFKKACPLTECGEHVDEHVFAPYSAVDFAKAEETLSMYLKLVPFSLASLGDVTGSSSDASNWVTQDQGMLTIYALTNTRRVKSNMVLLRKGRWYTLVWRVF